MTTTQNTTEKLIKFVNQRPRLEFADYGNVTLYRSDMREITKDRNDFFELLTYAQMLVENFEEKLTNRLTTTSGRLTLEDGILRYCTGQYFPTEYRPAANRVLSSMIWEELAKNYDNGHEIRKAAKRRLSRRVCKHYFN